MSEAIDVMQVSVNGEPRVVRRGMRLDQFLESLGLDPRKVAVERNEEIVPRSTYAGVLLENNDLIEVVHFIGGG